jgi:oligopeptide/dipeptide ABC transporter ATP-binding protein
MAELPLPAEAELPAGEPVLLVEDLRVHYPVRKGFRQQGVVRAVDGVTFDVRPGEVLALVGESGCGKTTIARAIMRLVEPTSGRISYRGRDITHLHGKELRKLRERFQMVFQDPYESLDPRQTVFETVSEPLLIHGRGTTGEERRALVFRALERAGLHPPEEIAIRYPHHLSGGQRQRVAIAAAMVLDPGLVVADEPVSMLDVSLRAGILKLMLELRAQRDLAYLFITHDLSLAWVVADRIAVVYLGRIVELGSAADVIGHPRHPYTEALVSVIPVPEAGAAAEQILLSGETPSPTQVPAGCRFAPRCWLRRDLGDPVECTADDPSLRPGAASEPSLHPAPQGSAEHLAACHFS